MSEKQSIITFISLKISRVFILLVLIYKGVFSFWFGGFCMFSPTCSDYALGCLKTHSIEKAFCLIFSRVCKCHPFSNRFFDPVPERKI